MATYGSGPNDTPPGAGPGQSQGGYTPPPLQPQQTGYTPPPGGPPMAVTGVPPKRKRSPLLIIGGIVLVLVLLCVAGFAALGGLVLGATQPVANAGEAYMTALRDGDYSKAFDLSSTALQQEVGNAQGLQTGLSSKQPARWSFTSRNVSNNQGNLSGTTTYKDGTSGTVDMVLTQVGNDWKVAGVSMK